MAKNNPAPKGQKMIVIVGPTASGKSDLGIKIAKKVGGEIISADSRQVYRGMDIGTGKVPQDKNSKHQTPNHKQIPNSKLQIPNQDYYSEGIRHYLIDVADPKKQFTADDFKKSGEKAIKEISAGGKIPVIVGGTGFYIDILLGRMAVVQVPPDKKLRARLDKLTADKLFEKLNKLDPSYSKIIDRHNKRRLIRALEIVMTTGKPVPKPILDSKYRILWLGLKPKDLEKIIEKRLDQRLKQGMTGEVKKLLKNGVSYKRLRSFGLEYRQISRYLQETNNKKQITNIDFKKTEYYENLLKDIIRYSKRQMTWFKKNKNIHWINNKKTTNMLNKLVADFLINN